MKWRGRDNIRKGAGANEEFACEVKAKLPDLAKELTSSAIGTKVCQAQGHQMIGGLDHPDKGDSETHLILKELIRHLTDK